MNFDVVRFIYINSKLFFAGEKMSEFRIGEISVDSTPWIVMVIVSMNKLN